MSQKNAETSDRQYYLFALRIAGDFGATIAFPVVIFVLLGRWLDGKYDRGITFTVIAFIFAALLSGRIIYKKSKRYGEEYQKLVDKKN